MSVFFWWCIIPCCVFVLLFCPNHDSGFDLALLSTSLVPLVLSSSLRMAAPSQHVVDLEAPYDDQCFVLYTRQTKKNHHVPYPGVWGGMQAGKLRGKAPFIPYSLRIKQFFDKWNGCRVDKDWSLPLTGWWWKYVPYTASKAFIV